jgi:hypothetical protein
VGVLLTCLGWVLPQSIFAQTDTLKAPQDSVKKGKSDLKSDGTEPGDTLIITPIEGDSLLVAPAGDTTQKDTSKTKFGRLLAKIHLTEPREHYEARTAVRRSLVLPGWGQLYNRRPWKVPIIYAGFATFAVFIAQNHKGYADFDKAVKCVGDTNSCVPNPYYILGQQYGIKGLISIRESYRRYRDLNIIFCGLWYVLQAVDAYVDAHLREFNVSSDLSLQLHPGLYIDPFRQRSLYTGVSLTLKLRR